MTEPFESLAPIAKSYYGTLTLARDRDGMIVAVRRLATGGSADNDAIKRIVRRAHRALGQTHGNIVPEIEVHDGAEVLLVNQYVEGAPLSTFARMLMTRPDPPDRKAVARIIVDALAGLEFLNVHDHYQPGGMTPDAIMICADGRTRLIEPMVQAAFAHVPALARHQSRVAYRAPEQLGDQPTAGQQADVFTMGVILWELLSKRRLFAGLGYDAIAKRIDACDVPNVKTTPLLRKVLEKALARDPEARFESASAMRADLKATAPHTDAGVVAKLFETVLGSHPSIQRVREAAAEHEVRKPPKRRIPPARPLTATPSGAFSDDDDEVSSSRRPMDSVTPKMPTEDELEGLRRQIGRGEIFTEVDHNDIISVHIGRWLGAAGFARLISVTTLQDKYADDDALVGTYLEDARTMSRVKHPNIVAIHDLLDDEDELLVVTDYFDGVSLAHVLRQLERKKERAPIGVASRIVAGVLHGLHAAHSATDESGAASPVVHRNVCPDDIIIGADGYPRLVNFGLEHGLEKGKTSRKRSWRYKAPEQVEGMSVTPRTDVYGAAAVAYHLFTGRRPFRGRDTKKKVLAGSPPKPTKLRGELPPKLEEYVLQGMAVSPDARWVDAEAMAEAIDDLPGMASHREVSEWLHDLCEKRLEHSERLKRAVGNAPVMLSVEELEEPLSVSTAPRESLAEIELPPGIFDDRDEVAQADESGKGKKDPAASKPPLPEAAKKRAAAATNEIARTAPAEDASPRAAGAPPASGNRTILVAVAAAAASAVVVAVLMSGGNASTAPASNTAQPTPTPTQTTLPAAAPAPAPPAPPPSSASQHAPEPSSEPIDEPAPTAPVVVPTTKTSARWPTPTRTAEPTAVPSAAPAPTSTPTIRLPDDI